MQLVRGIPTWIPESAVALSTPWVRRSQPTSPRVLPPRAGLPIDRQRFSRPGPRLVRQGMLLSGPPARLGRCQQICCGRAGRSWAQRNRWWAWGKFGRVGRHPLSQQRTVGRRQLGLVAAAQCWGLFAAVWVVASPLVGAAACGPALHTAGAGGLCAALCHLGPLLLPGVWASNAGAVALYGTVWGSLNRVRGCLRWAIAAFLLGRPGCATGTRQRPAGPFRSCWRLSGP